MTGHLGDLAAGDGYLGEIVDLPSGMVGLAIFNEYGRERRIVYVPGERVTVVKLEQERPPAGAKRDRDFAKLTIAHALEQLQKRAGHGW